MIDMELFKEEVSLADDECCIIFDFGCYFPYSNQDILTFNFSLGMDEFNDYKLNHRYPNKNYQTISRKYGRKVSKIGYPYIMKLNEQAPMLLAVRVGISDKYITLIFPVETFMTKNKPICYLSLHYIFDKQKFRFISYEKIDKNSWKMHNWYSHEIDNDNIGKKGIIFNAPQRIDENSYELIYSDIIVPVSYSLSLN